MSCPQMIGYWEQARPCRTLYHRLWNDSVLICPTKICCYEQRGLNTDGAGTPGHDSQWRNGLFMMAVLIGR